MGFFLSPEVPGTDPKVKFFPFVPCPSVILGPTSKVHNTAVLVFMFDGLEAG